MLIAVQIMITSWLVSIMTTTDEISPEYLKLNTLKDR